MPDRLIDTLSLAPSEQSLEDFVVRLKEERRRVVRGLENRRLASQPKAKKPKKAKATKKTKDTQLVLDFKQKMEEKAKKLGMTLEEFMG